MGAVNRIRIRGLTVADHPKIVEVIPTWWGGRDLSHMVPRLFAVHFQSTSFIAEMDQRMVGFLVGFFSGTFVDEAYIHFAGVDPEFRVKGVARQLYSRFFELCRVAGRRIVRCCTSPVNKGSISFHTKMGFEIEAGDGTIDGIPVTLDHNKPGDHKVQFKKLLDL